MSDTDSGRAPSGQALVNDAPAGHRPSGFDPSRDRIAAYEEADRHCSAVLNGLFTKHGSNRIQVDETEWDMQDKAFAARDAALIAMMPAEQDAINMMALAYSRLKQLGWNDPIYCPKDGSEFDIIEASSTGIHKAHYDGVWPNGSWWVASDGDLWPSRPTLYRVTEAEIAKRAELRAAFARDSDGNPKGEDGTASSRSDDSAGRKASHTHDRAALNEGEGE